MSQLEKFTPKTAAPNALDGPNGSPTVDPADEYLFRTPKTAAARLYPVDDSAFVRARNVGVRQVRGRRLNGAIASATKIVRAIARVMASASPTAIQFTAKPFHVRT